MQVFPRSAPRDLNRVVRVVRLFFSGLPVRRRSDVCLWPGLALAQYDHARAGAASRAELARGRPSARERRRRRRRQRVEGRPAAAVVVPF